MQNATADNNFFKHLLKKVYLEKFLPVDYAFSMGAFLTPAT